MVLETELRPTSDRASCESSMVEAATDGAPWVAFLFFLESASRGSSWQRWPILRLMHLVHGLSYSSCQSTARIDAEGPPCRADGRPLGAQLRFATRKRAGRNAGTKGWKDQGPTYEIACHMLAGDEKSQSA